MFNAIQVDRDASGKTSTAVVELDDNALPAGDVLVDVAYSTLNYKDGLVLQGLGGLVKTYPHVPGIDFSGTVLESADSRFSPGDKVVLTGWRVGELHWGGYAERARVDGDWLVPLPAGLELRDAMVIGTAGLTAMLALMALEHAEISPESGPVLVTGAAGGVGSIACALLSSAGYTVEGSTGRADTHDYLKSLGVSTVIPRSELEEPSTRPLNREHWAGCVDTVGGTTLATVLTRMRYGGAVTAIGLAGGSSIETTVIPFLLRGVSLLGIDSVMCPREKREIGWNRLAQALPHELLESVSHDVSLSELPGLGKQIIDGQVRGRVVVKVQH